LKDFDGSENEYPIFYCYMIINSIFSNNLAEAKTYYDSVKKLLVDVKKEKVLPYYYYVPRDQIDYERIEPGSQARQPSKEVENESTHLWTQSIWFLCQLLGGIAFLYQFLK
jgi:phosphorylase kinase alpha/beta subunit